MKICPNCKNQLPDDAFFCTACGTRFVPNPEQAPTGGPTPNPNVPPQFGGPMPNQMPPYMQAPPVYDPYDHTSEFDPKDISDNKVISMLVYLLGWIGVIIALLACNNSPYTAFHVRQSLKFTVVEILVAIISLVLCWTFIVPIAAGIFAIVLFVIKIICFFQICNGKAKEPAIIRSLNFLK